MELRKILNPFSRRRTLFLLQERRAPKSEFSIVADSLNDPGKVLLDPNKFSEDGTVALSGISITDDGNTIAYGISKGGSDWIEYRFRDIKTGKDLPDMLENIKFSGVSWTKDGKGVFYSRFPAPNSKTKLEDANFNRKLYFHKLGTKQSADKLIYERPDDKKLGISGFVTDDGNWLMIYLSQGTSPKDQIYYKSLWSDDAPIKPLITKFENNYSFVGNIGGTFYFVTDKDAPLGRLVSVNVFEGTDSWREVIPEAEENLRDVSLINNQFVANYLKDAYSKIRIFSLWGNFERDVELPGIGSAGGFGGKGNDKTTFYSYSSYNAPPTIYDTTSKAARARSTEKQTSIFEPNDFEVKQVFYPSKDGTKIPMFIVHKKGLVLDGTNPTLLYGYGGFNISMTPGLAFRVWRGSNAAASMLLRICAAAANTARRGTKRGQSSRNKMCLTTLSRRRNTLIDEKYTSNKKLAIQGGSNGGLLVGAVLNQRPDLFGAALPAVGVMDMLRFHKFTIGWAWTSDYGSSENADEFKAIYAYSPLHNIKERRKLSGGDGDDCRSRRPRRPGA